MKQIARSEFGGGLSEISLNKLIIKLIKRNIRIPGGSLFKTAKMHKALTIIHYQGFFFYIKPAFYHELEHLIQMIPIDDERQKLKPKRKKK